MREPPFRVVRRVGKGFIDAGRVTAKGLYHGGRIAGKAVMYGAPLAAAWWLHQATRPLPRDPERIWNHYNGWDIDNPKNRRLHGATDRRLDDPRRNREGIS
jgi:hypothetical protein